MVCLYLEKCSLNFSRSPFVTRVNFSIQNYPYLGKLLFSGFLHFKRGFVRGRNSASENLIRTKGNSFLITYLDIFQKTQLG